MDELEAALQAVDERFAACRADLDRVTREIAVVMDAAQRSEARASEAVSNTPHPLNTTAAAVFVCVCVSPVCLSACCM